MFLLSLTVAHYFDSVRKRDGNKLNQKKQPTSKFKYLNFGGARTLLHAINCVVFNE